MLWKSVVVIIVAVTILVPIHLLNYLGFFQHYFKQHPGTCRHVKGVKFGAEDFHMLSNGLTFVTSGIDFAPLGQTYKKFLKDNNIIGRIYAVDLSKPVTEAKEVPIKPSKSFQPSTFRPHGISVLEDRIKGQHLLYVINHCEDNDDRIEKFRYLSDKNELVHEKSFFSEKFEITNDLAVIKEDNFYVTNYLVYKSHLMSAVEQSLGLKLGSVVHFNGTEYESLIPGLFGPNGIIFSRNRRFLYVAFPLSQSIRVYEVKSETNMELIQDVKIYTAVDNLHLSQDGQSIFAGCHPIAYKAIQHIDNPTLSAPSQVIHLPLKDGKIDENEISQQFYDHGDLISGSTIASIYNKKLLIGSIISKLVVCDLA